MTFRIYGMDCAQEVEALRREIVPLALEGIEPHFDLLHGRMSFVPKPSINAAQVLAAISRAGLRAVPVAQADAGLSVGKSRKLYRFDRRVILCATSGVATAIAGGLLLATKIPSLPHSGDLATGWLFHVLCGIAIVLGGWHVFPRALHSARRLLPDMNLLMTIAVCGAVLLGEWLEAASVTFLFSLALVLESWSVDRARRAVSSLLQLAPTTARFRTEPQEPFQERPVEEVPLNAVVSVHPGEKIPLDGVVIQGSTTVNEAPITGESIPVEKQPGAEVFAGTLNLHGSFEFRVTHTARDTTLARIVHMIEEAQSRRAPTERWVDAFARWYTPMMLVAAVLIAVLPPLLLDAAWQTWFYEALVILVIACPCALVISTPVTIVAGLASAARAGVLIKGGIHLETPARLRAIALDKTGTLTLGSPEVQRIIPLNGHTPHELLARAAALEAHSNHPLAQAVLRKANQENISIVPAEQFRALPGRGGVGVVNGREFWVGSHRLLLERTGLSDTILSHVETLQDEGHSVVLIGNDSHVCGLLGISDALRDNARSAVNALKALGVQHVTVLTGDNRLTAQAVANAVGADDFHAELLPDEKVETIKRMVTQHGSVAMVGDGVNDAPALATATLGIAMGAAGSDTAIETADVALMSDDLMRIPWLIQHSRRTFTIVRQNITFALGTKAMFVVLTLAGIASLWLAIAADMGASLLVIANGLRLLRLR